MNSILVIPVPTLRHVVVLLYRLHIPSCYEYVEEQTKEDDEEEEEDVEAGKRHFVVELDQQRRTEKR